MLARPPKLRRRVLVTAALAGPSMLAVAELTARAVSPYPLDPPLYPGDVEEHADLRSSTRLDPLLGWRFTADAVVRESTAEFDVTYACDSDGFRATARRDGAERCVVFLGDSFTFGSGVTGRATFVERVADLAPGVQPENLGLPGFGVDQMLCALREVGLARSPDVVVAAFVVDDLTRSLTSYRYRNGWMRKPTFVLESDALVPVSAEHAPNALLRWASHNMHAAEVWRRWTRKRGLDRGSGERFELNLALFLAMRDACRAQGADFLVLHLPQRERWLPLPSFAAAFARADVDFLDLGALAVEDPRALYFAKDPHFNARGHEFVAQALAERWARRTAAEDRR
jgi:hypothetical protein